MKIFHAVVAAQSEYGSLVPDRSPQICISHTINLCKARRINIPNGHAIWSLTTRGIHMLLHVGKWTKLHSNKLIFTTIESPAPQARWTEKAREHCNQFTLLLNNLDSVWLFDREPTLMIPRQQCQSKAENYIRGLSHILSMPLSTLPHQNCLWGWVNDPCHKWGRG
jgi:hypothetical protein